MSKLFQIWDKIWTDDNTTDSKTSFREMLHLIQMLPKDFKGCKGMKTLVEKIVKRVFILFNIVDFATKTTYNMIFHSFDIIGSLADASSNMIFGNYYKAGFGIGRALDIYLS